MYIRGSAASLHPGSGLSRGKARSFATLAGAQEGALGAVPEVASRPQLRTEAVLVRLSPEERRRIREHARACGKGTSTYMREASLGLKPRVRPRRLEQQAVYQLGRLGNNLNQLARAANATGQFEESRRLQEILDELLETIRRLA